MSGDLAGTLSKDAVGNISPNVSFREGALGSPLAVNSTSQALPSSDWRNSLKIVNTGPDTVYYGFDNTVTSTDGVPVIPNGSEGLQIGAGIQLWLVCAGGGTAIGAVSFFHFMR